MINLPTTLTLTRIVIIPLLIAAFYLPVWWNGLLAAVIFVLAAVTDVFDGYLARRTQQTTRFGAFLDPVADKLIVAAALALIIERAGTWVVTVPALVIIAREITVSALREWMAEVGGSRALAVTFLAKLKTFVQMAAIIALLLHQPMLGLPVFTVGLVLLYVSAVLTVWSMLSYLIAARRHVRTGA